MSNPTRFPPNHIKSKRRPWVFGPRENPASFKEVEPRLKTKAYMRLAILRAYHFELSKREKPKTKGEVMRNFLGLLNSGLLWPDESPRPRHVARSTLYCWDKGYRSGGIKALVPRYGVKLSIGSATFRPLPDYTVITIPGPPRSRGKSEFLSHLIGQWQAPAVDSPIILSIFFRIPIPKGTRMKKRMLMLRHKISHTGNPTLDSLTRFVVDCLIGRIFKDRSQIILLHAEKEYRWFPQTTIFIRALSG